MAASNDVSVEPPATSHMYDSEASSEGMFTSSALDRESRIKELLSRQEQLLKEMRQRKEGDWNVFFFVFLNDDFDFTNTMYHCFILAIWLPTYSSTEDVFIILPYLYSLEWYAC